MKITLPEDISEIKLSTFQEYVPLLEIKNKKSFDKKKVSLFTGLSAYQLKGVSVKDFNEMSAQIDKALDQGCEFKDRFKMHGIEFGFIPNFDKITTAEFVDLSKYAPSEKDNKTETLNNLMAILFRPITKKSLGNYDIETYNGTGTYSELMKDTPMHIVNGALVFFYNLQKELLTATQTYTKEARKKVERLLTISSNGVGMQHSND